jgi:maleylacetoacetate isomerase
MSKQTASGPKPSLHLHTYFRSSCSARVRTAANLKGIPLTYSFINLLKNEQTSASYSTINPCHSVPTLTITKPGPHGRTFAIRQSVAILEYLEEQFPQRSLLPSREDVEGRAKVRELVNIIANDVQPPTNLRILTRVKALGGDGPTWAKELMEEGLQAYEAVARECAGEYSYGSEVTMADVVLAPAVEGALRWGVDISKMPTVKKVYENIRGLEAFEKADWKHQEDTPEELRSKA